MTDKIDKAMQEALFRYADKVDAPVDFFDFKAGYEAGTAQSDWVPIEDMPDEWKNEPYVDLWFFVDTAHGLDDGRCCNCSWGVDPRYEENDNQEKFWLNEYGLPVEYEPTHIRLPPKAPKK